MNKMNRMITLLIFLMTTLFLPGCQARENATTSAFFSNFSLGDIISKQEGYLQTEARVSSGAETGPAAPPHQKHEEMVIQIDSDNLAGFLAGIEEEIKAVIIENGGVIVASSSGSQGPEAGNAGLTYFSYHYSQGEINGVIHLYGVPGEGTVYYLISVLSES